MPNTKEKLIEVQEQLRYCAIVSDCANCKRWDKVCEQQCVDGLLLETAELLESIANGVTVQKWIPVTERLPEDDLPKDTKKKMIRCLVYTDKGTIKPCVRQRWEHFDGQLVPWQWNKDLFAKPTHWMYYPQPPKGECE